MINLILEWQRKRERQREREKEIIEKYGENDNKVEKMAALPHLYIHIFQGTEEYK